jgi:hypothetical protein
MLSLNIYNFGVPLYCVLFNILKVNSNISLLIYCRAVRIFKVFAYFEEYWKIMSKFAGERLSTFINTEERKRLRELKKLREKKLVLQLFLNVFIPLFILSLLSFIFPWIYTLIPVYESITCWAYFAEGPFNFVNQNCAMYIINNLSFILLSWSEIFGFGLLYWLIRDIRNELNMKREVQAILIFWTFFSLLYFILNLVNESLYIKHYSSTTNTD